MTSASEFYKGLRESIDTIISRALPFRAVVDSTPNGRVKIIPLEADTALGEEYAQLIGFQLNAGDEVAVITLGGKPFVLGKVQRAPSTGATFDQPILVKATDDNALRVSKADGTGVFRVDDNGLSSVGVINGVFLTGYSDDGVTSTFNLDSGTGNARFNGAVTGGSFNSPLVKVFNQSGADTASTTSTTVYSTAITRNVALPTGTWTVNVVGGAMLKHSADQSVICKVSCGGTSGAGMSQTYFGTSYAQGVTTGEFTGKSGTVAVTYDFRSDSAGTSTAKNPWLIAIATRTS